MTILEEFFSIIEGKKEPTEDKKIKKVDKVDKKKKPKSVSESTMDKANYLLD